MGVPGGGENYSIQLYYILYIMLLTKNNFQKIQEKPH